MEEIEPKHPWAARITVGLLMLILAFIGLIFMDINQKSALNYWKVIAPVFALLSIGLSYYLRMKKHLITFVKIWHEIFHWLGLIIAIYLFSFFVDRGLMGRFQAALGTLTLLALTTYLAGVYLDISLVVIGVTLGIFALAAAFLAEYLYTAILPLTILVGLLLVFLAFRKGKPSKPREKDL